MVAAYFDNYGRLMDSKSYLDLTIIPAMQSLQTTRLSSKGQIIIPKAIRSLQGWENGQEFIVEETENGILLRPYQPASLPKTTLEQVAGCLKNCYQGKAKTIEEMDAAIAQGIRDSWQ